MTGSGKVSDVWDVVIVGSGPAGSAAAIGALSARPTASVLMLDRSSFPRDKCCGDAVLSSGLRQLADCGIDIGSVTAGFTPVDQLSLTSPDGTEVLGRLPDSMTVIPRTVLDSRLLTAARGLGAEWERRQVREVRDRGSVVQVGDQIRARVVIGADGAESAVRRALGRPGRIDMAVALRGYARPDGRPARLVLDRRPGMSYAWSFPVTGGSTNVGYGHLLRSDEPTSRGHLLDTLRRLLPGVEVDPDTLRAHRLPLSTSRHEIARGRLLLAGDAAQLVNPISGEGIYYAISSGLLAGTAAVCGPGQAADRYRSAMRARFAGHHRHVSVMAALTRANVVVESALRAARADPDVFDAIAALGLATGRITPGLAGSIVRQLVRSPFRQPVRLPQSGDVAGVS